MRGIIALGLTVSLVVVVSLGAPAPKESKKPAPILGEWLVVSQTAGGRVTAVDGPLVMMFTADGKYGNRSQTGKETWHRYAADERAAPQALDAVVNDLPHTKAHTEEWLYRVEGDTLTICMKPDNRRPSALEAPAGSDNVIYTLKRLKPKN
jgi:uncharacterized protein (TIGR03067 family)